MKRDLPTSEQLMEELADKVAVEIGQGARVAFDAALDELVDHHRFLLAIHASQTPDGNPFSFAEIEGNSWRAPHVQWIAQYRRLFDLATNRLADDSTFFDKLANTPLRLLSNEVAPLLSTPVLNRILDLGPMMVHRLEAWVTKRTVAENLGEGSSPRLALAGSDRKAYSNCVIDLVGTWESLLTLAPYLYNWKDGEPAEEEWSRFRASWPFLWQHLSNSAYMLVAAVWNEDSVGADAYRDMLLRWPTTLSRGSASGLELSHRHLLFPDILKKPWSDALSRVKELETTSWRDPTVDDVLNAVIAEAHEDLVLLVSSLFAFWTLTDKQLSDIGARNARALLRREPNRDYDESRDQPPPSFGQVILGLIRRDLAGERFRDAGYGAELDRLVAMLDNMTERRVVPGRAFTPSTLHDREQLLLANVSLLLASLPAGTERRQSKIVDELAARESALPEGDRSLRNLLHELRQIVHSAENLSPAIVSTAEKIRGENLPEDAQARLPEILKALISNIENHRHKRLKEMPISTAKLEEIRHAVEAAVTASSGSVPLFRKFIVTTGTLPSRAQLFSVTQNGVAKGTLVDPPMAPESSGFAAAFAEGVAARAGLHVWNAFARRQRESVSLPFGIDETEFWKKIAILKDRVGPEPTLVVSTSAQIRGFRRFRFSSRPKDEPLLVEVRDRDTVGGRYVATIEGVDLYGAGFKQGEALLFSARSLRSLAYPSLNDSGHRVLLAFETQDEIVGTLRASFLPIPEWSDDPIVDIKFKDDADEEMA